MRHVLPIYAWATATTVLLSACGSSSKSGSGAPGSSLLTPPSSSNASSAGSPSGGGANSTASQAPSSPSSAAAGGAAASGAAPAAPALPPTASVEAVTQANVAALVQQDGGSTASGVLYVSIAHLVDSSGTTTQGQLDVYRLGVTKALNSLSIAPTLGALTPLDAAQTVYKAKLADFSLTAANVQTILGAPGAATGASTVGSATVVQGDWLVYAATRPEVYDPIMNIPNFVSGNNFGLPELETELNVNMANAVYIIAPSSTVTFDTRVLERVPVSLPNMPDGYYWRTYDFWSQADPNTIAQGIANPTVLEGEDVTSGNLVAGEMFFSLPNGLQGSMLSGFDLQHRIDANAQVATDHNRPQDGVTSCVGGVSKCGYVINGESCMVCHVSGPNSPTSYANVRNATAEQAQALVTGDQARYAAAVKAMGFNDVQVEPIYATIARYKAENNVSDVRQQGSEVNPVIGLNTIFGR